METHKMKTVDLRGKKYIEVKERVKAFNEDHENGSIRTKIINQNNNLVSFIAKVIPDVDKPKRHFTGHSFGTIDEVKAFEKLETVAVGRALAFAGYGIIEGIASADEMRRFQSKSEVLHKTSQPEDYIDVTFRNWKKENGEMGYLIKKDDYVAFLDGNTYEILESKNHAGTLMKEDLQKLKWTKSKYKD